LLSLQLDELMAGVELERELIVRDYMPPSSARRTRKVEAVLLELDDMSAADLLDLAVIARVCGFGASADILDSAVSPRGYRLLARVPRLPGMVTERLVEHFGSLQKLLSAGIDDLQAVDGVGETRARSVREGLSRLAESSLLERYI
jgi:diadenylate cyclase